MSKNPRLSRSGDQEFLSVLGGYRLSRGLPLQAFFLSWREVLCFAFSSFQNEVNPINIRFVEMAVTWPCFFPPSRAHGPLPLSFNLHPSAIVFSDPAYTQVDLFFLLRFSFLFLRWMRLVGTVGVLPPHA